VQYVDAAKQVRTREKRVQLVVQRMLERARTRKKKTRGGRTRKGG
jgi:hypothetical protein